MSDAAVHVPVQGFHASAHDVYDIREVVVTRDRYVAVAQRGLVRRHLEEAASWTLIEFTDRLNRNEGTALGPHLFFVTLFTKSDETVSAAFRNERERDEFAQLVGLAIGHANGW